MRPDVRRTVRASLRAGGEPIRRYWREPGDRMRRLVLLLDVSGSMEPYARGPVALRAGRRRRPPASGGVRHGHPAHPGHQGARAAAIPTRRLRLASHRVTDWSGGTRLGECLRTFNDEWGVRGMARGAIVVVLSDGWDRGDPEVLAEQMQRLQRIAHSVIWVNPLKVTPGYAPLAVEWRRRCRMLITSWRAIRSAAMEELARVISSAGS